MYPDLFTYNQILQSNTSEFFSTLKGIEIITNGLQFETEECVAVNVIINGNLKQIVLFTDKNNNAYSRYQSLYQLNKVYGLPLIPNFEIIENEFKINEKVSPVILININDTLTLKEYIDNISFLPELVDKLKLEVIRLFDQLDIKQIAHGNLTFESIRVNTNGSLLLTGLDNIYFPEFETSEINKFDFISIKNRDLISKGLILSAFEIVKSDSSIKPDNLIFNFNSKDLENPQASIAYTLLNNSGVSEAINYLNFETVKERKQSDLNSQINIKEEDKNITNSSNTQTVIISTIPNGITVRNEDFDAIGRTPYTIEIKEEDNPFQIVLQEKDKLKKLDIYYGMDNVEIDINNIEKSNSPEEIKIISTESILGSQKEDNTQRNIFWGYVIGLFILMILITINNYNHFSYDEYDDLVEVESVVDSSAVFIDSAAAVIDSAAYYYDDNSYDDNYNSIDYYYDSVVDSTAVVVDSAVVSPYYYE